MKQRVTCLRTYRVRPLIASEEAPQRGIEALVNFASGRLLTTDLLRKGLTRGYIGTLKLAPFRDGLSKGKSVRLDSASSTDTARSARHDKSLATSARELRVDTIERIVKVASETMAQRDEPALGEGSAKHRRVCAGP